MSGRYCYSYLEITLQTELGSGSLGHLTKLVLPFLFLLDPHQGFPWGTKIRKSLISDLCTEIVLFWWDFYLQGQH